MKVEISLDMSPYSLTHAFIHLSKTFLKPLLHSRHSARHEDTQEGKIQPWNTISLRNQIFKKKKLNKIVHFKKLQDTFVASAMSSQVKSKGHNYGCREPRRIQRSFESSSTKI